MENLRETSEFKAYEKVKKAFTDAGLSALERAKIYAIVFVYCCQYETLSGDERIEVLEAFTMLEIQYKFDFYDLRSWMEISRVVAV